MVESSLPLARSVPSELKPACYQQKTLMLCFSNLLKKATIGRVAIPVMTCASPCLQNRFKVVQDEQATMFSQTREKERYLVIYRPRQVNVVWTGDKADALFQEMLKRRSILERAPEERLECCFYSSGYHRSNGCFPDPSHA
jgi:hypothetical protein